MSTIFDLGASFRKSREREYTAMQVCRVLELEGLYEEKNTYSFFQGVRRSCIRFSMVSDRFKDLKRPERFRYLQFLYYICRKVLAGRKAGRPFFSSLEFPTELCREQYQEMLEEIHKMVSDRVRTEETEGLAAVLQRLGWLGQRLYENCCKAPVGQETEAERLIRALDQYIEQTGGAEKPPEEPLLGWDRLHLLLSYYMSFSREEELLHACRDLEGALADVEEILRQCLEAFFPTQTLAAEDKCFLCFENGAIRESEEGGMWTVESAPPEGYTDALTDYIRANTEGLAKKIFCKAEASRGDRLRVWRRAALFCRLWTMDWVEYGRGRPLRKGEMVAAYQVMSCFLPYCRLDLPGKRRMQRWKTVIRRRENRARSFYQYNPAQEPYCLQLTRLWTDVQYLRISLPPQAAEGRAALYLSARRKLLETILSNGRETPAGTIQRRAEAVLHLADEVLGGETAPFSWTGMY